MVQNMFKKRPIKRIIESEFWDFVNSGETYRPIKNQQSTKQNTLDALAEEKSEVEYNPNNPGIQFIDELENKPVSYEVTKHTKSIKIIDLLEQKIQKLEERVQELEQKLFEQENQKTETNLNKPQPYALDGEIPLVFLKIGCIQFCFDSKWLYKKLYKRKHNCDPPGIEK